MAPKPVSGPSSAKRNAPPGGANGRSDAFRQKMAKVHAARHIPAQPADVALKDGQLDLQAFLKAHEFEINALQQSMATSKAVSSSRAFQQVPRGLRRRTASHNPKRVPRRLRAKAKREMQEDNTPIVEARKRRPRTTRARIRAECAKRLRLLAARKRRRLRKKAAATSEHLKAAAETTADVPAPTRASAPASASASAPAPAKLQPRPKIRRNMLNDPPKAPARFRKRQIHKTWLPTHKWHAKRAKMTQPSSPLWRFAIPLTPNEKIYRAAHRAQGERGTLVWDMSYMSTIGLYGNPAGIEKILKSMGVTQESCWNDKGRKWNMGLRAWSGLLSREQSQGQTGRRWICPATVLWNPPAVSLPTDETESASERKTKRQVLIRLSPAAFLEAFTELVRLCKTKHSGVFVEDLRFEIGSIELTGPASTETLLGTMTPYNTTTQPKNKHAGLFESLKTVTNPASLPANAVLGFSIQDPRLRYPPRKMEVSTDRDDNHTAAAAAAPAPDVMELLAKWPAEEELEPYGLFDRSTRFRATCLPSQAAISKRKSLTSPGSFLKPSQLTDPPIPVILIASRAPDGLLSQGTWILLMPWKCVLPLWYSIVHCPLVSGWNPRFAGLNETMQVAFERGLPWFPRDFVATDAGATWEQEERRRRAREHEKRPKSKRIAFSSLDLGAGRRGEVGDGHACDFELIFGLPRPSAGSDALPPDNKEEYVHADESADSEAMDVDQQQPPRPQQQLVPAAPAAQEKTTDGHEPPPSLTRLSAMTTADFVAMTRASARAITAACIIPPNAVINVRLTLLSGGTVTTCARIYRLPSPPPRPQTASNADVPATLPLPEDQSSTPTLPPDLRSQWLAKLPAPRGKRPARPHPSHAPFLPLPSMSSRRRQQQQQLLAQSLIAPPEPYPAPAPNLTSIGGHPLVPNADDLIGFVTTGSYCLRNGKASAQASLAVEKIVAGLRNNPREGHLCIVRDAGRQVGWLARWEVL
ncbi:hypothetical protein E4U43_005658 [Claviceps pusilla]|uniref:Uncharacterized protein n=1 Tax=Claviceps pusilla TaxID=123648 RepID=A0A9P7NEA7_9HYPO|nr:hypothetical protein E4U43_005658 [Claviceps pusilla]